MKNNQYYDIIIIGAGIAGLYSAFLIKQIAPQISLLILEKDKLSLLGGRCHSVNFYGSQISTGAGVGRKNKDTLLVNLLDKLKIKYREYPVEKKYANTLIPVDVEKIMIHLKQVFSPNQDLRKTFKEFALPILGQDVYQDLLVCSGYTDYENAGAFETLYFYGFEDNYKKWTALGIPWNELIHKLAEKIGMENIKTNTKVTDIQKKGVYFHVSLENGKKLVCEKTIIATTIEGIKKLVPGANKHDSLYQQIHGQPFLRIYGKFSRSSIEIMKNAVDVQTFVPGAAHRIIPIDKEKGIYMIVYTDNSGALKLKNHTENTPQNREFQCRLIEKSLGLPKLSLTLNAIISFYWSIGTHYYEPLRSPFINRENFIDVAQNPMEGMVVVGESVALKQGWIEGALESVHKVINKKWVS
jgi:hypothetical protein